MLRKRNKTVHNTCVINVKSINYPKIVNHIIVYMYYIHPGCKIILLKVVPKEFKTIVIVYNSSLDYYHNPNNALTNSVKGIKRDLVRQALKKIKPFEYANEAMKFTSPFKSRYKNLQSIKSNDVVRRIKSEALIEYDNAKNDLMDLMMMVSDNFDYVKNVSLSTYIHCYSEKHLDLLLRVKSMSQKIVTGYLDAMDTVVRKAHVESKRILYYTKVLSAP